MKDGSCIIPPSTTTHRLDTSMSVPHTGNVLFVHWDAEARNMFTGGGENVC